MKAFVSYSISDNNDFVLTRLASSLQERGFYVSASHNFYGTLPDQLTIHEISNSNLFIGLITSGGNEANRVLQEWNQAVGQNVPNLLLIEDNVDVHQNFRGNYIRFNRYNPEPAIQQINENMNQRPGSGQQTNEILPWILGGAALLAIISLMGKKS